MHLRKRDDIDTIVIHCADTPNGYGKYTIFDIDAWHMARGFKREELTTKRHQPALPHIGYHKVIHTGGHTFDGRSTLEIGLHCKGLNGTSVGICLIGRDRFTVQQWASLADVVNGYLKLLGPNLKIIGHRDIDTNRTCPGFDVAEWLLAGMQPLAKHTI